MNDMVGSAGLLRQALARRGFMMTGLMAGFTLATKVVQA